MRNATGCALLLRKAGAGFDLLLEGNESALNILKSESGGHRFQRIPPTERKGRVQTSTITVSVFELLPEAQYVLREQDLQVITTKDSGPGGQHRNKTESCVVIRHLPTGIEAKASDRCQHANRRAARAMLEARVAELMAQRRKSANDNAAFPC